MRGIIPCRESKCYSFADTKQYPNNGMWYVECPKCHSKTSENITEFEAIREWKEQCGAIKDDDGKLRHDLISADALEGLANIYSFGSNKPLPQISFSDVSEGEVNIGISGDRNWEKGLPHSRVYAAILRHLLAWLIGKNTDSETGITHLAHAAWGCFALIAYQGRGVGTDDREVLNHNADN